MASHKYIFQSLLSNPDVCVAALGTEASYLGEAINQWGSGNMSHRYWRIRGYDSSELLFDETVRLGLFTENGIRRLLQTLAAKEGLSHSEIVGAYARRGTLGSNDHLEVHKDFSQPTWMCGSNPHFVASVVDGKGQIIRAHHNEPSRPSRCDPLPGKVT